MDFDFLGFILGLLIIICVLVVLPLFYEVKK
jgi:di/tricarboxylate transporter